MCMHGLPILSLPFHEACFITYRGGLHYGVNMSWIKVKNKRKLTSAFKASHICLVCVVQRAIKKSK